MKKTAISLLKNCCENTAANKNLGIFNNPVYRLLVRQKQRTNRKYDSLPLLHIEQFPVIPGIYYFYGKRFAQPPRE